MWRNAPTTSPSLGIVVPDHAAERIAPPLGLPMVA